MSRTTEGGVVLQAVERETNKNVLLQFWTADQVDALGGSTRLQHWMGTLSRLPHPSLATIHLYGALGDGFFLISDAPAGSSLQADADLSQAGRVQTVILQISDILATVRQQGVPLTWAPQGTVVANDGQFVVTAPFNFEATAVMDAERKSGTAVIEVGTALEDYVVEERIGEGAFGVVFRARQKEPVRRQVALKIVKPGMDSRRVLARFEAERQALALLDHPNIAHIYDAGSALNGRPFFSMEFVHGSPITEHCEREKLSMRDRVRLFVDVCHAIEHAHQKGIIHRDLKPSNVLIKKAATQESKQPQSPAVPKIIDFGVAKALDERLTDNTLFTRDEQLVGTPAYMSPEQAAGDGSAMDSRADIYGLGVLLYELLTGRTPFEPTQAAVGIDELRRRILEDDPAKPSSVAKENQARSRELHEDLDWIVLKALAKEPDRRYQSVTGFIDDLERCLGHEPVSAGPPSTTYQLKRFVRRNRLAVTAATVTLTALVGGLAVATFGLVKAADEAKRAEAAQQESEKQAEISNAVSKFLREDLLAQANPYVQEDSSTFTVRQAVDQATALVHERFSDAPEVRYALHLTLAETYKGIGDYEKAAEQGERAVALGTAHFGSEVLQTWRAQIALAKVWRSQGSFDRADAAFRKIHAAQKDQLGSEHARTLASWHEVAANLDARGDYDAAESVWRDLFKARKDSLGEGHPDTVSTLLALSKTLFQTGHPEKQDEAIELARKCVEVQSDRFGPTDLKTLAAMQHLSIELDQFGRPAEAEPLARRVLEGYQERLGPEHPSTLNSMNNLGVVLQSLSQFDEAASVLEEVLKIRRKVLNEDHPTIAQALHNLGMLLSKMNRYEEAKSNLKKALEIGGKARGEDHPNMLLIRRELGYAHFALGEFGEAVRIDRALVDDSKRVLGHDHPATISRMGDLAVSLVKLEGHEGEAEKLLRESSEAAMRVLGEEDELTLHLLEEYGDAILGRAMQRVNASAGKDEAQTVFAEAVPIYKRIWDIRKQQFGENDETFDAEVTWILQRKNAGEAISESEQAKAKRWFLNQ